MAKVREYDSEATIAAYLHRNEGEAYVKSYTAVNEELKIDSSKDAECISKVKVTMHVEEDKSVKKDGSFYEKRVGLSQERDGETSHSASGAKNVPYSTMENVPTDSPHYANELTPLAVLKNFVDNIHADNRSQWIAILALTIIIVAVAIATLMR